MMPTIRQPASFATEAVLERLKSANGADLTRLDIASEPAELEDGLGFVVGVGESVLSDIGKPAAVFADKVTTVVLVSV